MQLLTMFIVSKLDITPMPAGDDCIFSSFFQAASQEIPGHVTKGVLAGLLAVEHQGLFRADPGMPPSLLALTLA